MALQKIKRDAYNRKKWYGECLPMRNIVTPGRCKAAYKYDKEVREFVDKEIAKSINDTKTNQPKLLQKRIQNKTHQEIYPINNLDFDYRTAIIKNKNRFALGFTNKPTLDYLFRVPFKMGKYMDILVKDEYPTRKTVAGVDDVLDEDKERKRYKDIYYRMNYNYPYPSFRKDYPECLYPTTGEHSSSYFIKTGVCKTSIDTKEECDRKKFKWNPNKMRDTKNNSNKSNKKTKLKGACFKPRFTYIDNKARPIFGKKGLQPSMLNDIMSITPDKLYEILSGNSVEGGGILPCVEEYSNYNKPYKTKKPYSKIKLIFFLSVIIYLIYIFH